MKNDVRIYNASRNQRACIMDTYDVAIKFSAIMSAIVFLIVLWDTIASEQSYGLALVESATTALLPSITIVVGSVLVATFGIMIGATPEAVARLYSIRLIINAAFTLLRRLILSKISLLTTTFIGRTFIIRSAAGMGMLIFKQSPHLLYPLTSILLVYPT
jgi:hypothetical protein